MLGVGAAIVATLGPAYEAASVPAAAALKAGDEAPVPARRHSYVALALLVAAVGALFVPAPDGIALPGYAAIACLLFGAVFLTPAISQFVFARLPLGGPAWRQVAAAQLRGTARRSTVSIAAVLVSFSLMVAMAIMVYSFRLSLDAWMQRILSADVYVRAGSPGTDWLSRRESAKGAGWVAGDSARRFRAFPGRRDAGWGNAAHGHRTADRRGVGADILPLRESDARPLPAGNVPVGSRRPRATCAGSTSAPSSTCRSAARPSGSS